MSVEFFYPRYQNADPLKLPGTFAKKRAASLA
jgi:hypothetical protein